MNALSRVYTVAFENVTVSAVQDLFEIQPADDKPCQILGLTLDNVGGTADAGDAQEELLRCVVRRGYTTSGSGGSAPTPTPLNPNAAAAGFVSEVNNTTVATTGTIVDVWPFGWNIRAGAREFIPEELQPICVQGVFVVVRLLAAPADALSVSGCLWVAELA